MRPAARFLVLVLMIGLAALSSSEARAVSDPPGAHGATAVAPAGGASGPPTIASFTALPRQLTAGRSSTLYWRVRGATRVAIDPGVGQVTGSSLKVSPADTTTYTLTASNASGARTASVSITVRRPPVISSFAATPAALVAGHSSTLQWSVSGATSLTIDQGIGRVTGTSVTVTPRATTSYTITARNAFGTAAATTTVSVGSQPTITSFTATPSTVAAEQPSTLAWAVAGATSLAIDHGVGTVAGASVAVTPAGTTTYTLSAGNAFGVSTAAVTVIVGSPPTITSFTATPATVTAGQSSTLAWAVTGATQLAIDHGVGTVAGTSVSVSPTAATTYTLTASNATGSVTATARIAYLALATVTSQLFYSEHAMYIVPDPAQVTWTGPNSWDSVYAPANITAYVNALKDLFPDDYAFVVVAANDLAPQRVPNVLTYRHLADGIGQDSVLGVGVPNICRYHIGTGTVIDGAFAVLDHEIGHNWGVNLGAEVGTGHWLANSTATGQMASSESDDGYLTVKQIAGDPASGFTWTAIDNVAKNETEVFSEHDLYLQGLAPIFPDLHVLQAPVYQPDHTVSYTSVRTYDHAWVESQHGVREPSYRTSAKRMRVGFVYVARDAAEVLAVYPPIERSIRHFVDAEQVDTARFRFQVPYLVTTWFRASLDARLADLDGNASPTLSLAGPSYLVSADGSARVPFTAADPDGPAPAVSCVPSSPQCAISGSEVVVAGLASGTHFFTVKAEDAGGKKAFAHFVVDVE